MIPISITHLNNLIMTSIEYLGYELNTKLFYNISPELWEEVNKIFDQAIEMHKKEIEEAFKHGNLPTSLGQVLTSKEYYQETFGSKGNDECIMFTPPINTTSATICTICGKEKFLHKT
jgi:hypothetical protein